MKKKVFFGIVACMIIRIRFISLVCLLFCCSCQQTKQKDASNNEQSSHNAGVDRHSEHRVLPVNLDSPTRMPLSDYFESIALIPLETKDDVLIAQLSKLLYHEDRFYVLDKRQSIVFIFDGDGRYLFKIDRRGQGPGEYPFLSDMQINPSTNHLDLLCAMGFLYEYDLSGRFIRTHHVTTDYLRATHEFIPLNENTVFFFAAFHHPYRGVWYNLSKKEIAKETYQENQILGSMFNNSCFYFYNQSWYFYRPFDRQIFRVENENMPVAYTWDFGKYNRNIKDVHFSNPSSSDVSKNYTDVTTQFPYWIVEAGENNSYIIAYVKIHEKYVSVVYDKNSKESKVIDGFALHPCIVSDTHVLSYCNPGELESFFPVNLLDKKSKETYGKLIHLDANPIVIKYNFK
jgi:hypothetical protein